MTKINANLLFGVGLVILIISFSFVSAITASIGNSRMVVRIAPGETIEKSILVKNVNDVPVTISLVASGALKDNVVLDEESFELEPGEEKNAGFSIKADEEGSTKTNINIVFAPEEGNSVGLTSVVVVISNEDYAGNGMIVDEEDEENIIVEEEEIIDEEKEGSKFNGLLILTFLLVLLLVVLYFYSLGKKQKKNPRKKEK